MTFKVGDMAVYPNRGVGLIERIDIRDIAGLRQEFYVLRILENGLHVLVPVNSARTNGMREVVSPEEVERVFEVLSERGFKIDHQTWNRRQRDYNARIKTGSLLEVAGVLRDLALLKGIKGDRNLSFGERKMFDAARSLLIKEMAVASGLDEVTVERRVAALFGDDYPVRDFVPARTA